MARVLECHALVRSDLSRNSPSREGHPRSFDDGPRERLLARGCWRAVAIGRPSSVALGGRLRCGRSAGRATTTSRSISSTARSAASPASRCSSRSAACCRRTGCSAPCRRSAPTASAAATSRSASSIEPGHDLPDRRLAPPPHRPRPRRAELRRLPQRHRARHAHVAAARRAGHAGAQARPPGLRPVRPRVLPRQPADAGGRARARFPHRRAAVAVRAAAAARRPDRPAQAADAGPAQPHRADPRRARAALGPGRVDTFNPYKAIQFNWNLDELPPSELIGRLRLPVAVEPGAARGPAAALGRRQRLGGRAQPQRRPGRGHHAGDRRSRRAEARARLDWTLQPPAYPYPVDAALAARGAAVYGQMPVAATATTASATASAAGDRLGQVEDIDRIGTDRHRLDSYTASVRGEPVRAVSGLAATGSTGSARPAATRTTRSTASGCAAPYLHNGSVPTLRELLDSRRGGRPSFYRGYDVFDQQRRGLRVDRRARPTAAASSATTRRSPATATAGTSTARRCPTPTRPPSSST